ncbi:hypothetical protein HS1genome_2045 [Sulfodiicoccus acidiphilus]|uniref:Uncharacterized protein n=1 Tax=Sulfodiicoccus acidiphilus TaxID=1670455 RepID=A0A348B654_9CREN|nr:hypothetical protein [Sulfodiicoccus acidiphilus]BBD73656.1 hypothetical protein HS1genome_2045 [Sulfodiicoccus acidiphilus]GGU02009.1 hypothetical protein GCM10007116_18900 [Sulfodiicoccus acidiphilus]
MKWTIDVTTNSATGVALKGLLYFTSYSSASTLSTTPKPYAAVIWVGPVKERANLKSSRSSSTGVTKEREESLALQEGE